ncbi:unnamed protein product [Rhizoctonia solani]|uniref:Uncharacterized protein n=1 Tax=Rhizoctonia solani TaxID=456999 RepID=A0A8H3H7B2_9AGAM|nr:unnamed protein product [Rhizoctonia solani]
MLCKSHSQHVVSTKLTTGVIYSNANTIFLSPLRVVKSTIFIEQWRNEHECRMAGHFLKAWSLFPKKRRIPGAFFSSPTSATATPQSRHPQKMQVNTKLEAISKSSKAGPEEEEEGEEEALAGEGGDGDA